MKHNMRKTTASVFFCFLLGLGMSINVAHSNEGGEDDTVLMKSCLAHAKSDCNSWVKGGGGGELPRGLNVDTVAELASGETYILSGIIQIISAQKVFLKIDLKEYPWLASQYRKNFPIYRIEDSANRWKSYDGVYVNVLVTARNAILTGDKGTWYVETYLEPSSNPVLDLSPDWRLGKGARLGAKAVCR